MDKIFFSFGNIKFYQSLENLEKSVKLYGNVDKILIYKESDIDSNFYKECDKHFKDSRGYGYWVWKSYFIKKLLDQADNNDVFFYADAGNDVLKDLTPLYDLCQKDEKGIILFENTDGEPNGNIWKNNMWTKSDCFNLMRLKTEEYFLGDQVNASYILFRKTEFSLYFFTTYLNFCKNYNIISDAPNITEDFNKDFRDHRHDQSILSLLSIKHKISIHRDPSQWGNHRKNDKSLYDQLFLHHRRRSR